MRFMTTSQLPSGWRLELLDKVTVRGSGHTPSKDFPEYWNGGIKWISLSDSSALDQGYISKTDKEISQEGIKNSSAVMHPAETVVLSRDAGVGKSAVMSEPMAVSQHFIAWQCDNREKMNSWFLYNWLQMMKPEFERQAVGSTIKTIGLPYFKKLKIALPPYAEQNKIAQILSTWDRAIAATERLLDLARQQKKALMQQLLTGKKRFPGFEGEWKKCTLGELGDTFNGLTGKTKDDFGFGKKYIPYINIFKNSQIDVNALELVDVKEGESQSLSQYGDIFFTTSSETPDEVGMSSVLLDHVDELYLNSFCFGYRLFGCDSLLPEFARYLLRSEHVRGEIAVLGQGATRYNLSKKQLMKLELRLPPVDEQKKIALVLSSADQEIETLKSQLDGLKQEKKALMQTMLTGKRRVKIEVLND